MVSRHTQREAYKRMNAPRPVCPQAKAEAQLMLSARRSQEEVIRDHVVEKLTERGFVFHNVQHDGKKGSADTIDIYVGGRVKEAREGSGWSQEQLAEWVGVTFQQIQKYENGVNRVAAGRLFRIACAFGVEMTYFFPPVEEPSDG